MQSAWDRFLGRRTLADDAADQQRITQLRIRFPTLEPIGQPPPLLQVNGIGVTVFGRRDVDAETATYVKTLAVTLLWMPVFMLRAYRVMDAPNGGWYFVGREPLSNLALAWNFLGLPAVVFAVMLAEKL